MRRDAAVLKYCSLQRQVEIPAESLIGRPPLQVKTCPLRLLALDYSDFSSSNTTRRSKLNGRPSRRRPILSVTIWMSHKPDEDDL